jgi:hypothetical protein
MFSFNVYIID